MSLSFTLECQTMSDQILLCFYSYIIEIWTHYCMNANVPSQWLFLVPIFSSSTQWFKIYNKIVKNKASSGFIWWAEKAFNFTEKEKKKKRKDSLSIPQSDDIEPNSMGLLTGFIVCHTDQK